MERGLTQGKKTEIVLTDFDRQQIAHALNNLEVAQFIKTRAAILLRSADGVPASAIAQDFGVDRRLIFVFVRFRGEKLHLLKPHRPRPRRVSKVRSRRELSA